MTWLWWLILGLLGGWLVELAIDFRYWRKRAVVAQARIAEQEAELGRNAQSLATREAEASSREREIGVREETLAQRDADLLAQARRIDERDQEISRVEQKLDARRAELDKHATELIERDRDIAARMQVLKSGEAEHSKREARVADRETEQSRRQSSLASRETALKNWEQRILSKEQDIGLREATSARLEREHGEWKRQFEAMQSVFGGRYRTAGGTDDLQAIEGIGPKAVGLLGSVGISSFERLSETPLGELSRLVEQGGADLALADPMSWAEQASLIVGKDFVGFENLKATLRGDPPLLEAHAPDAIGGAPEDSEARGVAVTGAELAVADAPLDVDALAGMPAPAGVQIQRSLALVDADSQRSNSDSDDAARTVADAIDAPGAGSGPDSGIAKADRPS